MDLSDLYPHLLERLDDSQDMIRVEITKAIVAFFQCSKVIFFVNKPFLNTPS